MAEGDSRTLTRVTRQMTRVTLVANGAGALLDYLYLQFLAPGSFGVATPHGRVIFVVSAVLLPLYLGVAGVLTTRHVRRRAAWWTAELAGGSATPAARRAALGLRAEVTTMTAAGWGGAATIYGLLNVAGGFPAAGTAHIVGGILLGGAVTSTLTYLLAERRFRPVMVLALAGEPGARRGVGLRGRLLVTWLLGSALPLAAVGLTPLERVKGGLVSLPVSIASLAVIGLVAGYLLTRTVAASVAEPLAAVRRALDAVRQGDLSVEVPVDDPGEIGRLQADVNRMVADLRERRRLEELFGRHVGEAVARRALGEQEVLGGHARTVSVVFVDLIGSTALAASRPPDEVVTVLNRLFTAVVDAVDGEGGWVNKFEGDAALCIFGAPEERPDHATQALRAARALHEVLARPVPDGQGPALAPLDAGIGVTTGAAVAGNVGARHRYEYTVIGDPVNEAARLSELAKSRPGRLLASGSALAAASREEVECWQGAGESVLRGRDRPTRIFEPLLSATPLDAPPALLAEPLAEPQPPATAGTIDSV